MLLSLNMAHRAVHTYPDVVVFQLYNYALAFPSRSANGSGMLCDRQCCSGTAIYAS
jgi:hypothetical protein